jgi:hypothetical protein
MSAASEAARARVLSGHEYFGLCYAARAERASSPCSQDRMVPILSVG